MLSAARSPFRLISRIAARGRIRFKILALVYHLTGVTHPPRILMVSAESSPWAKTGGLADVVGALPAELARRGHEVATVIPRYREAKSAPAKRVLGDLRVP